MNKSTRPDENPFSDERWQQQIEATIQFLRSKGLPDAKIDKIVQLRRVSWLKFRDIWIERERMRAEHSYLFDEMLHIFARYDPMGIMFSTNLDEYKSEVGTILPRLKTAHSAADIRQVIKEEFWRWFGLDISARPWVVDLDGVAREIWDAWCRYTQ